MSRDEFEPVIDEIRPSASTRARSALGLVVLAAILGVVAAISIAVVVLVAVVALNNAL